MHSSRRMFPPHTARMLTVLSGAVAILLTLSLAPIDVHADTPAPYPVGTTFEVAAAGSGELSPVTLLVSSVSSELGPVNPADAPPADARIPRPAPPSAKSRPAAAPDPQYNRPAVEFPAQQCCANGNGWAPADANLAVSSNYIVEVVNASLTVYNRSTGGGQISQTPLKTLGRLSSGDCVDVTVIYWSWDDRFAFGCTVLGGTGNTLVIALSQTNNPSGSWYAYHITPDVFLDQPSITATADKISIGGEGSNGYEFYIFNKSPMLHGHLARQQLFRSTHGPYRATVHITNASDANFVSVSGSNMWLATFTGVGGNVHLTETALETKSYARFGDVAVPGGLLGNSKLDNRPLMAQQEQESRDNHDVMVVATLDQCGSNLCVEISRVDFTQGKYVAQQWHDSEGGADYTYPAVTLDGYGHVFVTYSRSGPTFTPQATEDAYSFDGATKYFSQTIYGNTPGTTSCDGSGCDEDWGDYSGAAQDPTNSAYVWVASEYQAASGRFGWGTVIAQADYTHVH